MIKQFGKALLRILGVILILLFLVMGFFRLEARNREQATNREIAPDTGRYVAAHDVDVFIQESGPAEGETLVFIHGTGAWGEIFRETMTPLNEAGYRTVAVDLPPFGFSDRPSSSNYNRDEQAKRIVGVIDALGSNGVTLVGHSFGGGPTVEAALLAPDKINRLILLDVGNVVGPLPFEDRPTGPGIVGRIAGITPLRNWVLASAVTNPRMSKTLLESLIHNKAAATDERVEMLQRPTPIKNSTHDLGIWLRANFLLPQPKMLTNDPANYAALDMPVLIIWGEEDTLTPLDQGEYVQSVISGSQLQTMADVGHIPQVEAPEELADLLLAFLAQSSR